MKSIIYALSLGVAFGSPSVAATYVWDCDGIVSNAYLQTSEGYRVFSKAKHVIYVSCPILYSVRGVACEASIDGRSQNEVWYDINGLTFFENIGIGTAHFDAGTGYFTYKLTEGEMPNLDETQRWFSAHCEQR